jgi:hypothetical protein
MTKAIDLKKYFLPLGMISLVVGILFSQLGWDNPTWSFFAGMGFGLSLIMNLAFLIRFGKANRRR